MRTSMGGFRGCASACFERQGFRGLLAALATAFMLGGAAAVAQPVNTTFVITNNTGIPNDQIYVKFMSSDGIISSATPQTYGNGITLAYGSSTITQSYTLADMMAALSGTNFGSTPVPTFALNNYSGRIYFSLGESLSSTSAGGPAFTNPADPDYNKTYGFVETSVFGNGTSSNLDISYVDYVAFPISAAVKTNTGAPLPITNGLSPQITNSNLMNSVQATVPSGAVVPGTTSGSVARILSSVHSNSYHDWSNLITQLQTTTATTPLSVSSYTVPAGAPLASTAKFTYVGGGASNTTPTLPSDFLTGQDYNFQATFVTDLNPNGSNPLIPSLQGVAGVQLSGTATTVGPFSIYITNDQMNAPSGVYGNNPDYTIVVGSTVYQANSGISNDLTGRIVGDLMAGMVFGWAANGTNIDLHATATGTSLPPGIFTEATVGDLGTGKYLYLLSLMDSPDELVDWLGSGITSNPDFYDIYAGAVAALSTAYGTGFEDRLQGTLQPIFFWPVTDAPPGYDNIGNGYVEIVLVPEPATLGLLGLAAAVGLGIYARRRVTR